MICSEWLGAPGSKAGTLLRATMTSNRLITLDLLQEVPPTGQYHDQCASRGIADRHGTSSHIAQFG